MVVKSLEVLTTPGGIRPVFPRFKKKPGTRVYAPGEAYHRDDWPMCGGVYFVQTKDEFGPIKIGHAVQINDRMIDIQIHQPWELRFLLRVDGSRARERDLHCQFRAHWMRGEWFAPHEELLAFIREESAKQK